MKTNKTLLGVLAVFVSVSAMADNPEISGVLIQQRWPWSRLVDIDYVLSCDPGQGVNVKIEAYDGATPLVLPLSSFSGDLHNVSGGARRIVWDPTMTVYTNAGMISKFRVVLTPTPVPLYMIVNLTKSAGESGQVAYVYEEDLTNGLWGAWVRNPVTNGAATVIESVVWTGVATNDVYKTDKLVLRHIPAGTFDAGDVVPPTSSTTLTKDLYAGVFEITQKQWELIMGTKPSYFRNSAYYTARPVEQVLYDEIRGATNSTLAVNWPMTDRRVVAPESFLGQLRTKTGLDDIDLPTSAQWEFFARAGTTTYYNDGESNAPSDGVSSDTSLSNLFMDVVGRYRYNNGFVNDGVNTPGRDVTSANGTAYVGSYPPNAWGLYDTLGNALEWCLDWLGEAISGIDPLGAEAGAKRVLRGGGWNVGAGGCRVGPQSGQLPDYKYMSYGFRVVRTLP